MGHLSLYLLFMNVGNLVTTVYQQEVQLYRNLHFFVERLAFQITVGTAAHYPVHLFVRVLVFSLLGRHSGPSRELHT